MVGLGAFLLSFFTPFSRLPWQLYGFGNHDNLIFEGYPPDSSWAKFDGKWAWFDMLAVRLIVASSKLAKQWGCHTIILPHFGAHFSIYIRLVPS